MRLDLNSNAILLGCIAMEHSYLYGLAFHYLMNKILYELSNIHPQDLPLLLRDKRYFGITPLIEDEIINRYLSNLN